MQTPREYDFGERLAFSQGKNKGASIESIVLANIPGVTRVLPASQSDDRHGTDLWAYMLNGHRLSIDAKVREVDWAATHPKEDDLALETYSVVEKSIPGWTRDDNKRTDYVLWLWADTGRWCLMSFPMLCSVFRDFWPAWRASFKRREQFTPRGHGGYRSECVFVPRQIVLDAIAVRFGGAAPEPEPRRLWHDIFGHGRMLAAFKNWRRVQFNDGGPRWILASFLDAA